MEIMYIGTTELVRLAENEVWDLKDRLEASDCSDETLDELCRMIDEETEELDTIDNLLEGDIEDLEEAYDIASDIIDWCRNFEERYGLLIAEI